MFSSKWVDTNGIKAAIINIAIGKPLEYKKRHVRYDLARVAGSLTAIGSFGSPEARLRFCKKRRLAALEL